MRRKTSSLIKTFLFLLLVFFNGILHAGVMGKPRFTYIINSEHFEILFSKPSSDCANLIAENAEAMYEKISADFGYEYPLKLIIIISPDSDTLSVKYTVTPYNRIVIYDSVPGENQEAYKNGLLDLFRHELVEAISQNVTHKFWYYIRKYLIGEVMQPVALLNVPYSFLEGVASAEDEKNQTGILQDQFQLQQLVQAKLDGKFPTLMQVLGTMDTNPGRDFCKLAGSAFCAYIQQRFGYEKFFEYWQMSGQLNYFVLHKGIFEQVYETKLADTWQEFIDEIPVPELIEDKSELFIDGRNESSYKFILHSPYGFIWYDQLKKEVDIYDDNSGFQKFKRLLFMASDINNLTLSPDGRFLIVSHTQQGARDNFDVDVTRIYDLKTREFTGDKFFLRSSSIIQLIDGTYAVAGVNVKSKVPELQVIAAAKTNKRLGIFCDKSKEPLFTRKFTYEAIPSTPVQAGKGKFASIINYNNQKYILIINVQTGEENIIQIKAENEIINLNNLRFTDISFLALSKITAPYVLMFDYISRFEGSLTKTGMIFFNRDENLRQVIVQKNTISGGIHSAVLYGSDYYYSSHKYDHHEFRKISSGSLEFINADFVYPNITFPEKPEQEPVQVTETLNENDKKQLMLGNNKIKTFWPIKYMLKGSWMPFMPIKSLSFSEGIEQWPGLGVAFRTGEDPFANNELTLSAGFGFLPLDFKMIFNATEEERKELMDFDTLKFFDDYTFAAFYKNSATPLDILGSGFFSFNSNGEYNFDVAAGTKLEIPLMMDFRRLTMNLNADFQASTTYWDPHQFSTYPGLQNWPKIKDSYKTAELESNIEYSNIHSYGISSFKKMGIMAGLSLKATWDINLMELQWEKRKAGEITSVEPENLTQAIENQLWANPYAPTQINASLYATGEIPQLLPFPTTNGWVFSLPATIYAEIFHTNGTAFELDTKFLLIGKEIQNGILMANIYFPNAGLYFGYNLQSKYDTTTIVLPDVRDFGRFYDAFINTDVSDSIYTEIDFNITPVIGKWSAARLLGLFRVQYYIKTEVWEVSFKMQFNM